MNNDRLTLTGLRAKGFHGVFPHERLNGQEFVVDLEIGTDAAAAAAADDLALTIHYGDLAERVTAAIGSDPVGLIETLAERIAEIVLSYPSATSATVTVHKPYAPITVPFDDVSITITRRRQ